MSVESKRKWSFNIPLRLKEVTAPATPPSGFVEVYPKTDGLYNKDDTGLESRLSNFVVCTSTTRPTSPPDGMQIYETDTGKTCIYNATKAGWFPPWNTEWGIIDIFESYSATAAYAASTVTDMALTVNVRADRTYEVGFNSACVLVSTATWVVELQDGGSIIGRLGQVNVYNVWGEQQMGSMIYRPSTTKSASLAMKASEVSGTSTFKLNAALGLPRQFWIKDVGPRI